TPEAINFMVRNGCGILGMPLSAAICDRLHLEPLPGKNVDPQATPWTPHIDARTGITTGTSAFDRARTIQVAIDDRTTPNDLVVYTSVVDPEPHLALCFGGVGVEVDGVVPVQDEPVLVRIHSQCLTGDIFHSKLCDCGSQLHQAMKQVVAAGKGVVLYMRQE